MNLLSLLVKIHHFKETSLNKFQAINIDIITRSPPMQNTKVLAQQGRYFCHIINSNLTCMIAFSSVVQLIYVGLILKETGLSVF